MDAPDRWQILRLHVEDRIPLTVLARERPRRRDSGTCRVDPDLARLAEGLA